MPLKARRPLPRTLMLAMALTTGACRALTLRLPAHLKSIDWFAFAKCTGLTGELKLPEGLTTLGRSAFSHCTGFTGELVIPPTLTRLETAFVQQINAAK